MCHLLNFKIKKHWILYIFLFFANISYSQDTIFIEMFDYSGNALPSGWTNFQVAGQGLWRMGEGAGPGTAGQSPLPDTTAYGQQNVYFRRPEANQITRLITPAIDTEFAVRPQLSFYHAQYPAGEPGSYKFNTLRVLVRVHPDSAWMQKAHYTSHTNGWVERFIDLQYFNSPDVQIAFEGFQHDPSNNSVCVDAVLILDIDSMERALTNINTIQASTNFIPTGTYNNPILRSRFRVIGNDGVLELEKFTVNSLNTNDNDIRPNGVKLYFTNEEQFSTANLLAQGNFVNGTAVFDDLELHLPTGYSYVWVTYDIQDMAGQANIADAYIPANGIRVNGEFFPETNHNPLGHRVILQTIFYDDFDTDMGWELTGEWERDIPQGLGGGPGGTTEGNPGADQPIVGSKILGTDLTGLGAYPGNYEPNLEPKAYQAIMPELNCYYFNEVTLSFYRWLNVYVFDEATIEISTNGGLTWSVVWNNSTVLNEGAWNHRTKSLTAANRKESVMLRFTLGGTGTSNLQSGWNIDELIVTGNYVTRDVGVVDWLMPKSSCGMTNQEDVTIVIKNKGAEAINDDIPVGFSLNGGVSWQRDTIWGASIPSEETIQYTFVPKADFSTPGRYNNVIVRTFLPGDQDDTNNGFHHSIFSIPTYETPYWQSFESNDGFWTAYGTNRTLQRGIPSGTTLNNAYDGIYAWITRPSGSYNPGEFSWVESPCFDFSDIEDPVIEFSIKLDTQLGLDGAALEYSLDQGVTWIRAEPRSEELVWNWHGEVSVNALQTTTGNGAGWSGLTEEWQRVRLVLPEELSGVSAVKFRLLFASQTTIPVTNQEGVAFDAVNIYETPYDVGVTAILEPESACGLSSEEQITIRIKNHGIRTLPAGLIIPAAIDLNEDEPVLEEFELQSSLEPESEITFSFNHLFDFSVPDTYNITAYTLLPGDTDFFNPGIFNDTLSTVVNVYGFPEVSIWPTDIIYTTQPDSLIFDAGAGFVAYLWQDNSENQTFSVTSQNTQFYYVTVTDDNACQSTDSVLVYTRDLEITELQNPVSQCEFFEAESVILEISNVGHDPYEAGYQIPVEYYLNNDLIETYHYTLADVLNQGESILVEFETMAVLDEFGEYLFHFEIMIVDAEPANNSKNFYVFSHGYPELDLGDDIYTLLPDTIVLDAGPGMAGYEWQDGYDGQQYAVTSQLNQLYYVTITDEFGCSSYDEVMVYTYDLRVTEILSPEDACELTDNETILFRLTNIGLDNYPGGFLEMSLKVNGNIIANETFEIAGPITIDTNYDIEFVQTVDMSDFKTYSIIINLLNLDANIENNQLNSSIISHGYPQPYLPPYIVTDNPWEIILNPGSGFASYLWDDGSTLSFLDIMDWGEYSVVVTNSFGCEADASTIVVPEVYDPSLHSIISPTDICYDEDLEIPVIIQLYNNGPAPLFQGTSIDFFYVFDENEGVFETIILSENFYPDTYKVFEFESIILAEQARQYNILVWFDFEDDEDSTNNIYDKNFDVFAPPVSALPDTIVTTNPLDLILDAGEGFVSYLWHDGSEEQFYEVDSEFSAWYYVTITDINSCVATDSVFVLTYDWMITGITNPTSYCMLTDVEHISFDLKNLGPDTFGQGFVFPIAFSVNGGDYHFAEHTLKDDFAPDDEIEVKFRQAYDFTEVGDYSISVFIDFVDTNPDNNYFVLEIEVAGYPVVNLGGNIITSRPDTVLLDAGPGFASYLWHNGYDQQVFHVEDYGLHWVEVTDIYECLARDSIMISRTSNISEAFNDNFKIYPNPADNYLIIEAVSPLYEQVEIRIMDISGKLIKVKQISGIVNKHALNITDLREGKYFIKIISKDNVSVYKLIKARGSIRN